MMNYQKYIRIYVLLLFCFMARVILAETYYANCYVKMEAVPTGQGTVYLNSNDETPSVQTGPAEYAELKATISNSGWDKDDNSIFKCDFHAFPADGYDFVAFAYKNESGIYNESDWIGTENPLKAIVLKGRQYIEQDYERSKSAGWYDTVSYVAIFKERDTSVSNVPVRYYESQDESFGSWTSELINGGKQVRLTATPAPSMRFKGWRNNLDSIVSKNEVYEVENVNYALMPDFDLLPLTLPADYCGYSSPTFMSFSEFGDLNAYKVYDVDGMVAIKKINYAGPNEGVILMGVADQEYELTNKGYSQGKRNEDNLLKGTADGPVVSNGNLFVLSDDGRGFTRLDCGEIVPQNSAYLEIDDSPFDFIEILNRPILNSISDLEINNTVGSARYNMAGQRVNTSYRGLVMENRRKVVIR